jgi:uncharacterized protein (DUF433 family)
MKSKIISTNTILFGKPRIRGTRIGVEQVLGCLAEGWTHKEIMKEFDITDQDIKACLDYAYQAVSRTHVVRSSSKVHA